MDLIASGGIFNFKPPNGERLDESTSSKRTSRFEELFLASPRAKELSSTGHLSYLSSSTSFDQHHTQLFTLHSKSDCLTNSTTSLDSYSTPFSPLIASPDTRFAVFKSQVNEVINRLATPKSQRDSGLGDTDNDSTGIMPDNEVIASDDDNDDGNDIDPCRDASDQCDGNDIDPTCHDASHQCDGNDTSENVADTVGNHATDVHVQMATSTEDNGDDANTNLVDSNCDNADIEIEKDDNSTDKMTQDKEPLPSPVSAPVVKKPHHLSEWCIKSVMTKNNPPGVIVEGQRPEDRKGSMWHSTMIVTRVNSCLLETKKKSCYVLEGEIEEQMTLEQGFSLEFVEAFQNGFPSNWKELVQEHFESFTTSSKKTRVDSKRTIKTVQEEKSTRTRTPQSVKFNKSTMFSHGSSHPIEVELKRTSSGRLIKPPLAWWRGQRILTDGQHNLTAIDPGGEEHTALSIGIYDFDLKVPKNKQSLLKSKGMTPKVAKFYLSPVDKSNKTRKSDKSKATPNISKVTRKKVLKSSSDGSSSEPLEHDASNKGKTNKRLSRIRSEDTQTDTDDSEMDTKLQSISRSRNTRTSRRVKTSKSSRIKYHVDSESTQSEEETMSVDENEKGARVENVKRNISFDGEAEPIPRTSNTKEPIPRTTNTKEPIPRTTNTKEPIPRTTNTKEPIPRTTNTKEPIPRTTNTKEPIPRTTNTKEPIPRTTNTKEPIPRTTNTKEPIPRTTNTKEPITRTTNTKEPIPRTTNTKAHNVSDDRKTVSPQKPNINTYPGKGKTRNNNELKLASKKSKAKQTDDDVVVISQDSKSYSLRTWKLTRPERMAQQARESESNKHVEQHHRKEKNKQQHTQINNDNEELPYLRHRNKQNVVDDSSESEQQPSSCDEEETQSISDMVIQAKERKATRVKQDKEEGESSAPTKTTANRSKKKPSSTASTTNPDETQWKHDELIRFTKALHTIPLNSERFWQRVAELVESRTAQECQSKYEGQLLEGKPKQDNTRAKQSKPTQKVVAITGGVGTVKRKRELRQLIHQTNDGYDDDIFDSTPYKKPKANFKLLVQPCSSDEDDGDEDVFVEDQNSKDYKTPSSRTPSSRYRPLGPVTNASNTPTADLISPSLLQPVNRADMDYYIQRMKQGRRGLQAGTQTKKTKTSTPKKTVSVDSLKVNGSIFDIHEAPDRDSEEENDDYFSDDNID